MTVAAGIEAGGEMMDGGVEAGGRLGAGVGQSQSAAFLPGPGKGGLGAAQGSTTRSSISGGESFRSSWQAMVGAWGAMPRANDGALSDETGTTGESCRANTVDQREGARNVQAPLWGRGAEAAPQSTHGSGQANGPQASAANPPLAGSRSMSGVLGAASALQREILPDAASAEASLQTTEGFTPAGATSRGTVHSPRSSRLESPSHGAKAEQQAGPVGNGANGPPDSATAIAAAAAAPIEAQVLPQDLPGVPASNLPDRIFGPVPEQASGTGAADEPIPQGIAAAGWPAAAVAQTPGNAWVASTSSMGTTSKAPHENETGGVAASGLSEAGRVVANEQTAWAPAVGTPTPGWQMANTGQQSAENGSQVAHDLYAPAAPIGAHREAEANSTAQSPTADVGAEEPGVESAAQSSSQAAARSGHGAAAGEASPPAAHAAVAQPSSAIADASTWVRDLASTHGQVGAQAGAAGSAGTPAPAARGTFAALDAGTAVGTPSWIHAGDQRAEAGFEDPALGWVGVRADLNGGSVHAAVVPGSAEAAQALSGHLAGLSVYLAEQHTPVATVTMAAPGGSGMESGVDRNMQQSGGQNAEQNATAAPQPGSQPSASANAPAPAPSVPAQSREFDAFTHVGERRGVHISVMA